jgi:hypothetical protein
MAPRSHIGFAAGTELATLRGQLIEDLEPFLSALGPASLADLIAAKIGAAGMDLDFQHRLHSDPAASRPGQTK